MVLCFATLWFGVLVPVHNRGEIRLPGAGPAADATCAHRCCDHATAPEPQHGGGTPCHDDGSRKGGSCAVCFFIAGLDAPPPVTMIEARLGLVGACEIHRPDDLPAARVILPFHSRGPPTA